MAASVLVCQLILVVIGGMTVCSAASPSRNELISFYFREGFPYRVILCFLYFVHRLSCLCLSLKGTEVETAGAQISEPSTDKVELSLGSSSLLGYRALWHRLRHKWKMPVPRDMVMCILRDLDPIGTSERKQHRLKRRKYYSKGPNYVWHCDGYDKLKPYGFAISGCIDGYSRRILWLKVGTSNNNPAIIAGYYLATVKKLGGCPRVLRSDCGTENSSLAFIQPYLRRHGLDCFSGVDSFRYGRSISNQRIEAFWGQLLKSVTHWWREFFQSMQHGGLLDETIPLHVDCLRLSFMHLIEQELKTFTHEWNTHRIRQVKNGIPPWNPTMGGIPDELYFVPQVQGTRDYLCEVRVSDLATAEDYAADPHPPGSLEFLELVKSLMERHNIAFPQTIKDAVNYYVHIVSLVETVYAD